MDVNLPFILVSAVILNLCVSGVRCHGPWWVTRDSSRAQQHQLSAQEYQLLTELGRHPESIYSEEFMDVLTQGRMNETITPECARDVTRVFHDLANEQMYALMIQDSIGKQGAAVLDGNTRWFGSHEQCKAVRANETQYPDDAFNGQYCTLTVAFSILVGVCVPDTCNETDVKTVYEEYFDRVVGATPPFLSSLTCVHPVPWRMSDTIMVVVTSVFGLLVLLSTGYEVYKKKSQRKKEKNSNKIRGFVNDGLVHNQTERKPNSGTSNGNHGNDVEITSAESGNVSQANRSAPTNAELRIGERLSIKEQNLQSFSILTNGRKMMSMSSTPRGMGSLNGMRVLSMAWVLLGHAYAFMPEFAKNTDRFRPQIIKEFTSQFLIEGDLSVDTFFFLSGFLVAFGTLKVLMKTKGKLNWLLFYINRYLRLTPVYMFVLFLMITLVVHMVSGPYESYELVTYVSLESCYEYWWTNLLYINTLYPEFIFSSCMAWTWYLSHDMIFFLVSPLFTYLLYRKRIIGYILLALGVISNFMALGITHDVYNLSDPDEIEFKDIKYLNWVYFKPQYRFAPYLIGIACADIYMHTKDKVRNMKAPWWKVLVALMWAVALALNWALMYGFYSTNSAGTGLSPPWFNDLYESTFRAAWAVSCAWIIYACLTGWGGFINSLLSLKVWEPLCRLCYLAYLLHPMVMYTINQDMQQTIFINHWVMGFFFVGYLGTVFTLSVIIYLLVEQPLGTLQKIFLKK